MNGKIERLAKEAGLFDNLGRANRAHVSRVNKFVALIVEGAAKTCETLSFTPQGPSFAAKHQRNLCAAAIRAKFALSNDKHEAK